MPYNHPYIGLIGIVLASTVASGGGPSRSFKAEQISFPRVKAAFARKEALLKEIFHRSNLSYPPLRIFIRVFKREGLLELWGAESANSKFKLVKTYRICASSGALGPKRAQGDGQVPEGFYKIERFNPLSNYHLSLGIDYPNRSDKILGRGGHLGGDIFVHGNCVTIGCVPIGDDSIEEVYAIAVEARQNGQSYIPVHIFPAKLDEKGVASLHHDYAGNHSLASFWANLKQGFDYFEQHRRLASAAVDRSGQYIFSAPAD